MKTITNFLAIPLNLAVKLVKMLQIRCNAFYGFLVGVHDAAKVLKGRPEHKQATPVPACNGGFPHAAKVLKGRSEHKQATIVPARNGMKTRFPDENYKTRRPSKKEGRLSR